MSRLAPTLVHRIAPLLGLILALCAVVADARRGYDRVPDLCRAVTSDPSYKVRVSAALVLGKLRDTRALGSLKKALKDPHYAVRASAAQALGSIGHKSAIPALELATRDSHNFVRSRAKQALELIRAVGSKPKVKAVPTMTRTGKERYYVGVGGMGDKSRRAGKEMVRRLREFVVRELQRTPTVTLSLDRSGRGRKLKAFTLESSITELTKTRSRHYVEISCEVSYVVGLYPTRSIVMMTTGGATIQTPRGQFRNAQEERLRVAALEQAVRGAHQNLMDFLKKHR